MMSTRRLPRSERSGGRSGDATAQIRHQMAASLRQHPSRSTACFTTLHEPWRPDLALGLDALGPVDDERVRGAAPVGLPLPPPERRVAGPRPAPRIVVEGLGTTDLVDAREAVLEGLRGVV